MKQFCNLGGGGGATTIFVQPALGFEAGPAASVESALTTGPYGPPQPALYAHWGRGVLELHSDICGCPDT